MVKVADLEVRFNQFKDETNTRLKSLEIELAAMRLEANRRHEESTKRHDDLMEMMTRFIKIISPPETTYRITTQPTQYDDFGFLLPNNKTDFEVDEELFENTRSVPKEGNDEQGKEEKGVVKISEVGTDEENNFDSVWNDVGGIAYGKGDDTWADVGLKHESYLLLDRILEDGWYLLDELGLSKEPLCRPNLEVQLQLQLHVDRQDTGSQVKTWDPGIKIVKATP